MEYVLIDKITGCRITNHYPNPCTRCKKTDFYICKDGDYLVSFCADKKCMKIDSDASKAKANEEYAKRMMRDHRGIEISGATHFKMGSMFKNASLSKWIASDNSHNIVSQWMKDESNFLVILGGTGVGKTFLCASVLNYFFDQKKEIFYTNHRRFIYDIQKGFGNDETQDYSIDKIAYKDILILDDLGAATNTEWQKEMILDLIDKRYSSSRKTLITSNLNAQQIYDSIGNRTASRLFSKRNHLLEFWTNDRRKNENPQDQQS